ncbi:low-density lipoprotein receptor-related protein 1-like [Centruroides sculpturatus]|uniref:low-density lipoprotein receptor-related protein 1-like n=1 Tax=Centruroides sculpturatus TaxID=218467 RepID=UPI000C6DD0D5|nr:low-density lipoprotein receptor-related protein 1-like [Centruroides sculpturatus]
MIQLEQILTESVSLQIFYFLLGNMYWIDPSYDVIEVAHLNGSNRFVVISGNMDKPKAIVVHPFQGFLFWSDWGISPKIERARLDGSDRKAIISSSIQMVNDLAIDYDLDKLYWCDTQMNVIEQSDLDGTHRKVVIKSASLTSPLSLTVYGEYMYWIDTMQGSILRMNKSDTNSTIVMRKNLGDSLKDIQIFHKRKMKGNKGEVKTMDKTWMFCTKEGSSIFWKNHDWFSGMKKELFYSLLSKSKTIMGEYYVNLLDQLDKKIGEKRPELAKKKLSFIKTMHLLTEVILQSEKSRN